MWHLHDNPVEGLIMNQLLLQFLYDIPNLQGIPEIWATCQLCHTQEQKKNEVLLMATLCSEEQIMAIC